MIKKELVNHFFINILSSKWLEAEIITKEYNNFPDINNTIRILYNEKYNNNEYLIGETKEYYYLLHYVKDLDSQYIYSNCIKNMSFSPLLNKVKDFDKIHSTLSRTTLARKIILENSLEEKKGGKRKVKI